MVISLLYRWWACSAAVVASIKELFKEIKNKFIKEPILKIYRLELLIRVEMDLLDFILGIYMV